MSNPKQSLQEIRAGIKANKDASFELEHGCSHGPLYISRTIFKSYEGNEAHGFLIWNDFDQTYVITTGPLPKLAKFTLEMVLEWESLQIANMIDNARDHTPGINIDGVDYLWNELGIV